MTKALKIGTKTMAIKARLANKIRTALYAKDLLKYTSKTITDKEKIALFDDFLKEAFEMHQELSLYKWKRQDKAKVEALRVQRGAKPKKNKTTKEEYEKSLQTI